MGKWFVYYFKRFWFQPRVAYFTTDSHELAPYPNMTKDDLQDFERWADGL